MNMVDTLHTRMNIENSFFFFLDMNRYLYANILSTIIHSGQIK
jgi:hypothetical protein